MIHQGPTEEAADGAAAGIGEVAAGVGGATERSLSPWQAQALQRSAGNAAVVRLDAERSGDDDSAVHDVLGSLGQPLGRPLLAEMEARFGGADFSDVRLHTGASARRSAQEMQARAFTSRNHIVMAGSAVDKETLAHELRHVEQQRSGPVPGTDRGHGVRVSHPSDPAERDAEATARQVMSGPAPASRAEQPATSAAHPAAHPAASSEAPGAAGAAAVQRKPVTQIESTADLGPGDPVVRDITIVGRPDSPHPGTEGEHTTAMIVLEQGVRAAIVGKNARAAGAGLWALYQRAASLPGAALVPRLPTGGPAESGGGPAGAGNEPGEPGDRRRRPADPGKHRRLIEAARAEIEQLGSELHGGPGERWDMTKVQRLATEYLQYRGLLPLSTMDRKATGAGDFGKGKGESGPHRKLMQFEAGDRVGQTDLRKAIRGLMDRLVVTEYGLPMAETTLQELAPGTDPEREPTARVEDVVRQHVESIATTYPNALNAAWGSVDVAVEQLTTYLADKRAKLQKMNVDAKKQKITELRGHYLPDAEGKRPNDGLIQSLIGELALYGEQPPPDEVKSYGRGHSRKAGSSSFRHMITHPKELLTPIKFGGRSTENTQGTGTFAISVELDDAGTITGMSSAGRPASPFSGTEGAHTTAWLVHLDNLRRRLVGRSLDEAVDGVAGLVGYAQAMEKRLAPVTAGKGDLESSMAKLSLAGALQDKTERADLELERASDFAKTAAKHPSPDAKVLAIQRAARAVLARINLIPGVAYDEASTAGRGEGTHRQTLLNSDENTPQETLQDAIFGLLDVPKKIGDKARLALLENHIVLIKGAYPRQFAASGIPEDPAVALELWKQSVERRKARTAGGDAAGYVPGRS